MPRLHWGSLLSLLSLVWLLGCGGHKPGAAVPVPPKPPEEPFSWLPEESRMVGRVALAELRKSALWPLVVEAQAEGRLASWVALAKVRRVTFGGSGQTRRDSSYVAALEGDFSPSELRDLAARDRVPAEQRGLLTLYRRPDGVWTQIAPGLIVTATPDRLEALVARAGAGPGTAVKERALYRSLAERVGFERAQLGFLAEDPQGEGRDVLERRAARVGLGELARDASRLGLGLELGAQMRLVAVAEAESPDRAQALEANARDAISGLASNLIVRMLGLSPLLSALRTASDGNYVFVRGDVAEAELNEALKRVQGALELAAGAGLSSGAAP